jgi:hypothetical protein
VDRKPSAATSAVRPLCRLLRERTVALALEAELETDPQRARQWRRERRELQRRAEQLGCHCTVPCPETRTPEAP